MYASLPPYIGILCKKSIRYLTHTVFCIPNSLINAAYKFHPSGLYYAFNFSLEEGARKENKSFIEFRRRPR